MALHKLGRLVEAEECYKGLCDVRHPDWWLLHEYAKVIKDKGDKDEAFKLMCRAAVSNSKLDLMVTLFMEMGLFCMEIGKKKMARAHLTLSSLVRAERGWSIPEVISTSLSELNSVIGNDTCPLTIQETLARCRTEWESILGSNSSRSSEQQRKPRRGIVGKVLLGDVTRQFCFIKDDCNESYFCLKSDLPEGVKDGEALSFTALPSFDKKKNKESWKAVDIIRL